MKYCQHVIEPLGPYTYECFRCRTGANDTYSDFTVCRQKVLNALQWLKQNNPYYKSITIDHATLNKLPENDVLTEILNNSENTENPTQSQRNIETNDSESDTNMDIDNYNDNDTEVDDTAQHNYTCIFYTCTTSRTNRNRNNPIHNKQHK